MSINFVTAEAAKAEAVPLEDPLSDDPENGIVVGYELGRAPGQFSGSNHGPTSLEVHQHAEKPMQKL